jgi:uncharacterized protein (TIGR02611 family)
MSEPPSDTTDPPGLIERLRERRIRHREHGLVYRAVWVVAGFTVLLTGLAMVVLPGPAVVVIPLGLAMLAVEFAWAERLLDRALERAAAARRQAAVTSPRQRMLAGLAIVCGAAALVAWAAVGDVPLLPV